VKLLANIRVCNTKSLKEIFLTRLVRLANQSNLLFLEVGDPTGLRLDTFSLIIPSQTCALVHASGQKTYDGVAFNYEVLLPFNIAMFATDYSIKIIQS
jgi:hypothetical protein